MVTATKERPVIMTGESVRAILDGRKTQTRRVVKRGPIEGATSAADWDGLWRWGRRANWAGMEIGEPTPCPYGKLGDRLWVRETWSDAMSDGGPVLCYKADLDRRYLDVDAWPIEYERYPGCKFANWASDLESGTEGHWRSSMYMPRWASRLTLEITEVRVQRLQEITEEDAAAECPHGHLESSPGRAADNIEKQWCRRSRSFDPTTQLATQRALYSVVWDRINGKKHPWASNCWVWAITFKRVTA